MVAVQVFDQRKFKRRDQGFLGVINVKVSDVLDLELGGTGNEFYYFYIFLLLIFNCRNENIRIKEV